MVLEACVKLTAARYVNSHMDWFVMHDVIGKEAGKALSLEIDGLIKEIGKYSLEICEGFGIPKHMIHAPIYNGYQNYYKVDKTDGEHYERPNPMRMNAKF